MGRPKKEIEKVELVSSQVEDAVVNKEEVVKEESIFDRLRIPLTESKSDYLTNYTYAQTLEALRYLEKHYGRQIPLNTSCASCVIDIFKSLGRLEPK